MAVLRSGILGHTSGKVAGVVGGKWKNKSYIREYVIPANPNTTPQQTQRSKMRDSVAFAKGLVGQVFNVYVDKFQKAMSGFNYFISQNIAIFDGSIDYEAIKVTFGKLWAPAVTLCQKVTTTLTCTWTAGSIGNNGSATDKIYAVAYNHLTGLWYFAAAEVARSVGSIVITVPSGGNGADYNAWVFAAKYSSTSPTLLEMVSDGIGQAVA